MAYKLDLHTHSIASLDGGITEKEYEEIITKKILDIVAITDHNRIDFALKMHQKLGDKIIVGEEILSLDGEVIGLFLTGKVSPCQKLEKTIQSIHEQGGIVYIPHPLDKARNSIGEENLERFKDKIDIIEGFNGRMIFPWENKKAQNFAIKYKIPMGVGSDAHGFYGVGKSYVVINIPLTKQSLKTTLQKAKIVSNYQLPLGYLYPAINKLRKFIRL